MAWFKSRRSVRAEYWEPITSATKDMGHPVLPYLVEKMDGHNTDQSRHPMTQPDIQRLAGILRMHMGHTFINNAYHPAEMVGIITSYPVNDGRRAAVFNLLERPGSLSVEEIRDLNETPLRGADGKPGLPLIDHATENGRITDPVIVERRVREAMAQNAQIRARIDAIKFGKTTKGS